MSIRKLVAVTLLLIASALRADFEAGLAAADRGDYAAAMRAWLPLAEQGFPDAQYNVALLYQHGWGVQRDLGEAIMWHWAAAAQGEVNAQFSLARMYEAGEGMPPTPVEAYGWYAVAARGGHPRAAAARDALAQRMPAEMRAQGEALAEALWTRYGQAGR